MTPTNHGIECHNEAGQLQRTSSSSVAEQIHCIPTGSSQKRKFTMQQFDFLISAKYFYNVSGLFEVNTVPEDVFVDHVAMVIPAQVHSQYNHLFA